MYKGRLYQKDKEPKTLKHNGPDGYAEKISYFISCIRDSRPPSIVTAADGVDSVALCEAANRSIELGEMVTI